MPQLDATQVIEKPVEFESIEKAEDKPEEAPEEKPEEQMEEKPKEKKKKKVVKKKEKPEITEIELKPREEAPEEIQEVTEIKQIEETVEEITEFDIKIGQLHKPEEILDITVTSEEVPQLDVTQVIEKPVELESIEKPEEAPEEKLDEQIEEKPKEKKKKKVVKKKEKPEITEIELKPREEAPEEIQEVTEIKQVEETVEQITQFDIKIGKLHKPEEILDITVTSGRSASARCHTSYRKAS
ncbi:hypothetical protein MRX96_041518 [Rhipicephalus microplus]